MHLDCPFCGETFPTWRGPDGIFGHLVGHHNRMVFFHDRDREVHVYRMELHKFPALETLHGLGLTGADNFGRTVYVSLWVWDEVMGTHWAGALR